MTVSYTHLDVYKRQTQGSKEDGEKDAIDCQMEDTVSRTHRHREYYNNYQRYQLMQVDNCLLYTSAY